MVWTLVIVGCDENGNSRIPNLNSIGICQILVSAQHHTMLKTTILNDGRIGKAVPVIPIFLIMCNEAKPGPAKHSGQLRFPKGTIKKKGWRFFKLLYFLSTRNLGSPA